MPVVSGSTAALAPRAHRGRAAARRPIRWERGDHAVVGTMVTLLVLTQRLGIPVADTKVSIALPLCYLFLLVLFARRKLAISRLRAELFMLVSACCLAVTIVVGLRGMQFSILSLGLLLTVYLPWVLRAAGPDGRQAVQTAGLAFVRVMLVVAALGALQFTAQLAGAWTYEDYLKDWIPSDFLLEGFNSVSPVVYGSDTIKSTAFLMLEPSALSQFCALAVVVAMMLGRPAWEVLVLAVGVASAVSGTGILLLIVASVTMLVRAPRMIRPGYLVTVVLAVVLVLLSPVAALLLDRADEVSEPRSSGYSRFVAPYVRVAQGLEAEPFRYLSGAGAGMSEQVLTTSSTDTTLYSALPKLTFEYGLVAGGAFALFLVVALLARAPWRVVPSTLLVLTFFLQGGLLQPQTTFLAWALAGLGADDEDAVAEDDPGDT